MEIGKLGVMMLKKMKEGKEVIVVVGFERRWWLIWVMVVELREGRI